MSEVTDKSRILSEYAFLVADSERCDKARLSEVEDIAALYGGLELPPFLREMRDVLAKKVSLHDGRTFLPSEVA